MSAASALAEGLAALGLSLDARAQQRLLAYLALVEKWNRVYSLTAVRDTDRMVPQHLLDSLAVVPHLRGESLLDVGSGAGLPGLPLAVARPAMTVTLLEASHKKSAFLKQAAIELALPNLEVVHARVEAWEAPRAYDVVISRAFSDLAEFAALAGRHVAPGGMLAAMKGVYPYEELGQLPSPYRMTAAVPLQVPGLAAERHLVLMERA